ncbi:endonuclease/exonuclease/phosphatase family protein [Clostridiaceae bacterium HSG29]|nr:endonuclease/exonuclease/phosphatase family protein [Clostridiaceae bacterium HSG29]
MKKIFKTLFIIILLVLLAVALLFTVLTITDYQPDSIVNINTNSNQNEVVSCNEDLSILTWNIGYGSLSKNEDFFMDDGEKSRPDSKSIVENNMNGIVNTLNKMDLDFSVIQEIDIKSRRSYNINQLDILENHYENYSFNFAKNYDVLFVPVPWPPLGKIESGISTFTKYSIEDSKRYQFEGNYSWPKKIAMLDRCFSVSTIPIESKKEKLLIINAHFSAYDDGTLRKKQLEMIKSFITNEYKKGNYIVLGGDFNQTFDFIDISDFPLYKEGKFYMPHAIPKDFLDKDWKWGVSENAPTYRLLNTAYEKGITQVGVIDGFLVSPNITIKEVEVLDCEFNYSDHNPVKMIFELN